MTRTLVWNTPEKRAAENPKPKNLFSCSDFDLKNHGLLRQDDFIERGQTLALNMVRPLSPTANWARLRQNVEESKPTGNHTISLCGNFTEPHNDYPQHYFDVTVKIRAYEKIR